jgi:hypothetical protein
VSIKGDPLVAGFVRDFAGADFFLAGAGAEAAGAGCFFLAAGWEEDEDDEDVCFFAMGVSILSSVIGRTTGLHYIREHRGANLIYKL